MKKILEKNPTLFGYGIDPVPDDIIYTVSMLRKKRNLARGLKLDVINVDENKIGEIV